MIFMRIFASDRLFGNDAETGNEEGCRSKSKLITRQIERAQNSGSPELRNSQASVEYDDVNEQTAEAIYAIRRELLEGGRPERVLFWSLPTTFDRF